MSDAAKNLIYVLSFLHYFLKFPLYFNKNRRGVAMINIYTIGN